MDDNLDQLLRNLKLDRIRQILTDEIKKAMKAKTSYEEFLAALLRGQYQHQTERSIRNRIKNARIPEKWSLATFPFDRQPGVDARVIRQLGTLEFVGRAENLVLVGEPGVGKTGIATGLLLRAIESGYRGRFVSAQDLFDELYASLADRSTRRLLNSLARVDVLLVDEMGYLNLRPEQSNAFFKLMEQRYVAKRSTVITTNLAFESWFEFLGNKKMVEALLDRLRHRCFTITIDGPSLRAPKNPISS
jgi:DNA replication protein DnaC